MDPAELAASFDVEDSGLIDIVHQELVEGDAVKRGIKMELYRLSVYGKDSFFKTHRGFTRRRFPHILRRRRVRPS